MSRLKEIAHQWISRITEIWRSVLSWMHWSQRRREREHQQQKELLRTLRGELELQDKRLQMQQAMFLSLTETNLRLLLLEALRPVAAAMQRQDNQHQLQHQVLLDQHQNLQELLLEVLNSLQPSAAEQIFPRIGQPPPTSSFPSLAS